MNLFYNLPLTKDGHLELNLDYIYKSSNDDQAVKTSNKDKANSNAAIPTVKLQICNNIWKLFASRHKEVNPNGFKNFLLDNFPGKEAYINSILDGHIYGRI